MTHFSLDVSFHFAYRLPVCCQALFNAGAERACIAEPPLEKANALLSILAHDASSFQYQRRRCRRSPTCAATPTTVDRRAKPPSTDYDRPTDGREGWSTRLRDGTQHPPVCSTHPFSWLHPIGQPSCTCIMHFTVSRSIDFLTTAAACLHSRNGATVSHTHTQRGENKNLEQQLTGSS